MPRDTVSVFSTPRGIKARCAECGSGQRLPPVNRMRTPVVLNVVPANACSTLRGMRARYAACGSWQRDPAKRSCSCRVNAGRSCLNSAFYRRSRPTRACSGRRFASSEIGHFSALISATMCLPSIGGGAAKAQPVGWPRISVFAYDITHRAILRTF